MKTLEEKIEVMQADLAGKEIECKYYSDDVWENGANSIFNWGKYDYRIKPENKQVPFDNSDYESKLGKKFRHAAHFEFTGILTSIDGGSICVGDRRFVHRIANEHLSWFNDLLNRWESCTKTVKE